MTRLVLTEPATIDIEILGRDLMLKAGNAVASRYLGKIDQVCDRFTRFPSSGAPRRELGKSIRMAYVRPYAILYRYDLANDVVFVLRVLHGKRNITRALLRGEPNITTKGKSSS
jgi:toxin ParE1/3/4